MAKAPEAPNGGDLPSRQREVPNLPTFIPRTVYKFGELLQNHPIICGGGIILIFVIAILATT